MTWNDTQGETLSHKCDVRHCASTDGAPRAQNCALYTSVCFVVSVPLFAMWFRLFMSVCRSQMFVNMRCRIHSLYSQLGSANGNHSGSLLASRFRRATWRNAYTWAMFLPENGGWRIFPRWYRVLVTKIIPQNKSYLKKPLQHQDQRGRLMLLPGNLLGPRVLHPSGEELRHRCLPPRPSLNFIHPKQLSPFPERLELPFPSEEILSGFEDIVSSGTDEFTAWVKTDRDATLAPRGSRQTLMLPWYDMWSMCKKPLQIFARHQKGDTIQLLRHTASKKNCLIVRPCRSVSASTTGIQDPDAERKMPLRSKSQAGGMSSRYKKHLSMSTMTFLLTGST